MNSRARASATKVASPVTTFVTNGVNSQPYKSLWQCGCGKIKRKDQGILRCQDCDPEPQSLLGNIEVRSPSRGPVYGPGERKPNNVVKLPTRAERDAQAMATALLEHGQRLGVKQKKSSRR